MQNKKKIFLVTGGAGFIGSHTVEILIKRGFKVRVLDSLIGGSLKNLDNVKNHKNLRLILKDIKKIKKNSKIFRNVFDFLTMTVCELLSKFRSDLVVFSIASRF